MEAKKHNLYYEYQSVDVGYIYVWLDEWSDFDDKRIFVRTERTAQGVVYHIHQPAEEKAQAIRQAIARFDALVAEYSPKVEDSHDELMATLPDDYPPYEPGALADDTEAVNAWIDGGYEEMEVTQEEDDFPW